MHKQYMATKSKHTDITLAVLISIAAVVPLFIIWYIESLILYFAGGGTWGGLGAGPSPPATWVKTATIGLLFVGIVIDVAVGVHFTADGGRGETDL